jgi:hypothetical protein
MYLTIGTHTIKARYRDFEKEETITVTADSSNRHFVEFERESDR